MTRYDSDLDPELERLGDALRTGATIDLARETRAARDGRAEPDRARFLRRPRILAGGTLGLAGAGTALALALTAGGAAAPAAFAITTNHDGTLTVNVAQPGQGLFPLNEKLAKMGYNEHIEFTMEQGPASTPGIVGCVSTPAGADVPGPAINVTVGPGDSNTETIGAGNTGAGTWHVASCQRLTGAEGSPPRLIRPAGNTGDTPISAAARRHESTAPVAFNLDTDGGLTGVNRKLAAMGTEEHVYFTMKPGAASSPGVISCAPADASVTGAPVSLTVGSGDSNTETIAAGNTGAGTWHVASCTRYSGTYTARPAIVHEPSGNG